MTPRTLFYVLILMLLPGINGLSQVTKESSVITHRAGTSVLSSGKWYKVKILHDGIYKLTFEDIKAMGFPDPQAVRVFGNGGTMLPLMNSARRYDDLVENSIYMFSGDDGTFGPGDYILFYGHGPLTWKLNTTTGFFEHTLNYYSSAAYYFITTDAGEGKKVSLAEAPVKSPDITSTSFNDYDFHERNRYNLLKSGRQWYGERLDYSYFDTTFTFTNLLTSSPVKIKSNVVSRSANSKLFIFHNNDKVIGSIAVAAVRDMNDFTSIYANQNSGLISFNVSDDKVNVNVTYNKIDGSDEGFLDYITVNVRRKLIMLGNALFFRDKSVTGSGNVAKYSIENCSDAIQVWDITDFAKIRKMQTSLEGSVLSFTDNADSLKEYVAINPAGDFLKPVTSSSNDVGDIPNQNLHSIGSAQMLIVTHPMFKKWADSIALFHQQKDNMTVQVITSTQIYNEFSSGASDVSAIRDFAKMVYDRSTNSHDRLKYLLLFGDGSYNNISQAKGNSNFIPTYQSDNSLNPTASYVSDDFFGYMGDQEGGSESMEQFSLDLGVGRLPANNEYDAMVLYRKITNYNTKDNRLDWRNNILFVGDDENANIHMSQANSLADWVRGKYPQFVVKKVLLDAYKQVATSTGARYPEVNRIITNDIQKGILIYNYTGHGGEHGMAAEQILMREDIEKLTNSGNLPLFVTATCEFSRFDDLVIDDEGTLIQSPSAGETSLLNDHGGSIALLSTTRIVFSGDNHYLNTKFYHIAFERDEDGKYYRLGDIIRMTKDSSGVSRNKLNFILLGDPALTLAVPEYSVKTDSLNGKDISQATDTLKAFSHVRISGHLTDISNQLLENFNGTIYPSVFDKNLELTTLSNDGGNPYHFETQENLLFKGKASVRNGYFSFDFMVPKDITYSFGKGKIVYYSEDSTLDANGYYNEFIIGGTDANATQDTDGPDISLYLNDDNFRDNGITNPNPVIYATLSDASGINTVGNGIGHDITGVIDGKVSDPVILNDFFEAELDDYSKGKLSYPMYDLSEGSHSLTVKVWDIFNNSSEETIDFQVIPGDNPVLSNVYNYPNPASDITWFKFDHNKAGEELSLSITVFDMEGRLVTTIQQTIFAGGFSSEPLEWDLKDANGNMLRQGIYPYRIRITDKDGRYAESVKKLVIVKQ